MRSLVTYNHALDRYTVSVNEHTYSVPASLVRLRLEWRLPKSGDDLADVIISIARLYSAR